MEYYLFRSPTGYKDPDNKGPFMRLTLALTFSYDAGLTREKQIRKTSWMDKGERKCRESWTMRRTRVERFGGRLDHTSLCYTSLCI